MFELPNCLGYSFWFEWEVIFGEMQICIDAEKYEKVFVPKFDGLKKHTSHWKALATKLGVTKGQYYISSILTNMPRTNVGLQHYMIRVLFLITIFKLDQILNANATLCNL